MKSVIGTLRRNRLTGPIKKNRMEKGWSPRTRRAKTLGSRQVIQHTYGSSDDNDSTEDDDDETSATRSKRKDSSSKLSMCKCGSTQHKYISHRKCPLNKKTRVPVCETTTTATDTECDEREVGLCTCHSLRGGTHQRSFPLNSRNISNR